MERIIRVTGKGKVSVAPDMIRIDLTAESVFPEYEETVRKSAENTKQVREAVAKAGLDPKDLKTVQFNFDSSYESYTDRHNNWKKKFVGYRYIHRMYVEFPNDNEILGKVLYELADCPAKVEFHISYTVKDIGAAKEQLLENAINDARAKAAVMAKAAGVALGGITTIDYSWKEMEIFTRPLGSMMSDLRACECDGEISGYDIDLEAEYIDAEDTVTVIWQIGE